MGTNIKKEFTPMRNRKPDISNLIYGKIPPQAPKLEEAILGAIMLETEKLSEIADILQSADCFYVDANQKIYSAILRLSEKGMPIDLLTVTEELRKSNELEIVGGATYITRLTFNVVSSANTETHARIVMEKFLQRELIRISGQTVGDAYEDSTDVFDLIERVQSEVNEMTTKQVRRDFTSMANVSREVQLEMEAQREAVEDFTGIPTGFSSIDKLTGGWQPTDLIILAARPAVGKTAFVLNLAYNAAVSTLKPSAVGFFSLEMGRKQLNKRLLSRVSDIEMERINRPKTMRPEEYDLAIRYNNNLAKVPIHIDDSAGLSIFELRTKARRMVTKYGVELIIVDYLQLMKGDAKAKGNREQEISGISRDLKILAKELEVPIIALSQLNRGVESRADNKPKLSDLRESGAIEQDADVVCFLYRPSDDEIKQDASLAHTAFIDFQKHRNGSTEKIPLLFYGAYQRWDEPKPAFEQAPFSKPNAGMPSRLPYQEKDDMPF